MSEVSIWIALFALGLFGLNWPLLAVFHESPFWYLLGFWLLFLVLVGRAARRGGPPPEP